MFHYRFLHPSLECEDVLGEEEWGCVDVEADQLALDCIEQRTHYFGVYRTRESENRDYDTRIQTTN